MTSAIALLWAVAFVGPVLVWLMFRSRGYKRVPLDRPPIGADWQPTAERFLDPTTEIPIETWYNAATGERAYVRLDPSRPHACPTPGTPAQTKRAPAFRPTPPALVSIAD
jgi:hypothetical protein